MMKLSRYRHICLAGYLSILSCSFLLPMLAHASTAPPITLVATTPLPEIVGDFDHFAVDLKRNHLFISAEEHHSIELFDLKSGKHLKSIGGVQTPHTLAFVPEKDELFISDGGASACIVLSGDDFHETGRIPLAGGPDSAFYDADTKIFYVGNGGRGDKSPVSKITEISVTNHRVLGEIEIDGDNVESMAVDHAHSRLFVNIRDKKQVGVVDLTTKQTVSKWTAPEMNRNTTLAFDAASQRVFVAGRTPGKFFVFNAENGHVVSTTDCVNIADGMVWDSALRRIYVTGSQGVSIFHQRTKDEYEKLAELPTNGGKTSIYVPQLKQLYIVHPKTEIDNAALLVYQVNP
jgi:DNA-binding beta-propeller fold protein YncE